MGSFARSCPQMRIVPRVGGMMPARRAQRGGLARAVRTDQAEDFAGLDGKGEIVHGGESAVQLGETLDFNHTIRRARTASEFVALVICAVR